MAYPVALVLTLAAGREDDFLRLLPVSIDPDEPGVLTVEQGGKAYRFFYKRVVKSTGEGQPVIKTFAVSSRPSSGNDGKWSAYILQPDNDTRRGVTKAFRDRLMDWLSTRQPSAGRWHCFCHSPGAFKAVAPAPVWAAVKDAWWVIWRAESSAAGVASQQGYGDADLEREEDEAPNLAGPSGRVVG